MYIDIPNSIRKRRFFSVSMSETSVVMFRKLNLLNRDESILQITGLYRSAPIGCNPVTPNFPEAHRI